MKNIIAILCMLFLVACASEEKGDTNTDNPSNSIMNAPPAATNPAAAATNNTVPAPPSNGAPASAVGHFVCADNCVGGVGEAAGNCPVCGKPLVHNQAFHAQGNPTTPPAGQQNLTFDPNNPNAQSFTIDPNNPNAKPPEPPQNAKGVWHYTCPKGCAGGSGAPGNCPNCDSKIEHNPKYHEG